MIILLTIIIIAIIVGFVSWCSCKLGSDFDDYSEKSWRKFNETYKKNK